MQAGSQVASTAADQAKQVAQETQRQATDLLDQGRTQVREQAISQQQKAGQSLSSLAQELRGLADGTSSGAPGPARDLLQQGAGMVENFASKLQNREPAELLDEVRSFARRKPGLFLLGAAAAGVLAGRLTSGVTAAHSDSGPSSTRHHRLPRRSRTTSTRRRPTRDTTSTYTGTGAGYSTGRLRPAAAAAVRHGAARGQRRAAGHPGRLGRPGAASRWGGLSDELPLLRRDVRGRRRRASRPVAAHGNCAPTQNYAADYSGSMGTPTTEAGRPDVEGTSVGQLIGEVTKDLSTLMRQELELAKVGAEGRGQEGRAGCRRCSAPPASPATWCCCSCPSPCGGRWRTSWTPARRAHRRRALGRHRRRRVRHGPEEVPAGQPEARAHRRDPPAGARRAQAQLTPRLCTRRQESQT